MKKTKIILIVTAILSVAAICLSVLAAAENAKTVQLVTLDYIENKVMPEVADKIKTDSPLAMQDTVNALNSAIDRLNSEIASGKTTHAELQGTIDSLSASLTQLKDSIQGEQSALAASIAALSERVDALAEKLAQKEEIPTPLGFDKITLAVSERLTLGDEGILEVILLSGTVIVCPEEGILDYTAGILLAQNAAVTTNNRLIVFAKGECLLATEDATILVKGEYDIVKQ